LFALLLVVTFAAASISFAKYAQSEKMAQSAAVGAFVPTLTYDESWKLEGSLVPGSPTEPERYPFVVTNDSSTIPILVVVELTVEQVLPLEYVLYLGEQQLEPESVQGDTRIYTHLVQNGEANFALAVSWLEGEHDERFNGLTNDVRMVVVCEQTQVGGAG
jgi:hypothetical protein